MACATVNITVPRNDTGADGGAWQGNQPSGYGSPAADSLGLVTSDHTSTTFTTVRSTRTSFTTTTITPSGTQSAGTGGSASLGTTSSPRTDGVNNSKSGE
jgi:hypothetical protein